MSNFLAKKNLHEDYSFSPADTSRLVDGAFSASKIADPVEFRRMNNYITTVLALNTADGYPKQVINELRTKLNLLGYDFAAKVPNNTLSFNQRVPLKRFGGVFGVDDQGQKLNNEYGPGLNKMDLQLDVQEGIVTAKVVPMGAVTPEKTPAIDSVKMHESAKSDEQKAYELCETVGAMYAMTEHNPELFKKALVKYLSQTYVNPGEALAVVHEGLAQALGTVAGRIVGGLKNVPAYATGLAVGGIKRGARALGPSLRAAGQGFAAGYSSAGSMGSAYRSARDFAQGTRSSSSSSSSSGSSSVGGSGSGGGASSTPSSTPSAAPSTPSSTPSAAPSASSAAPSAAPSASSAAPSASSETPSASSAPSKPHGTPDDFVPYTHGGKTVWGPAGFSLSTHPSTGRPQLTHPQHGIHDFETVHASQNPGSADPTVAATAAAIDRQADSPSSGSTTAAAPSVSSARKAGGPDGPPEGMKRIHHDDGRHLDVPHDAEVTRSSDGEIMIRHGGRLYRFNQAHKLQNEWYAINAENLLAEQIKRNKIRMNLYFR